MTNDSPSPPDKKAICRRRIIVLYHPPALLWDDAKVAHDADRPLSEEGKKMAEAIGQWLRQYIPRLGYIVTGPFFRTQQTAQIITRQFPEQEAPVIEHSLLFAPGCGPEDILRIMNQTASGADEWGMAILHQPDVSNLLEHIFKHIEPLTPIQGGDMFAFSLSTQQQRIQAKLIFAFSSREFFAGHHPTTTSAGENS